MVGRTLVIVLFDVGKGTLHLFHGRNLDPLSGCHMTTCFYGFFLLCMADIFMFMGIFDWRVGLRLKMPVGSMILHTIHVEIGRAHV